MKKSKYEMLQNSGKFEYDKLANFKHKMSS